MDFSATISAGLIAGGTMAALLYLGALIAPTQMKMDLLNLLGSPWFRDEEKVYKVGSMVQAILSIAVALVYVGIIEAIGLSSALAAWGLLFGLVHYLIAGALLRQLPRLNLGRRGPLAGEMWVVGFFPGVGSRVQEGETSGQGTLAANHARATIVGFFLVHLVFGVMVCGLDQAFGGA